VNNSPQQTIPQPEFFLLFFVAAIIFAVQVDVLIPFACGSVVFAPMLLLLLSWMLYWIFGNTSGGSNAPIGK
jgi:hypothetical protein